MHSSESARTKANSFFMFRIPPFIFGRFQPIFDMIIHNFVHFVNTA